MRLAILEYNMELFGFGIFAGMIIAAILMCVWGAFRKDDGDIKGTDKNSRERNNGVGINSIDNDRQYRSNNYNDYRESRTEEIIEDLIICDILGIL